MVNALFYEPRVAAALWRAWAEAGSQPARKPFGLGSIPTPAGPVALRQRERALSPFALLSRFLRADRSEAEAAAGRRILLIPPISGAFPFILRQMVETLAPEAEVLVLEWLNARFAPAEAGRFEVDDEIEAVAAAIASAGAGVHVAAVCQAGPASLAAAAALTLAAAPSDPPPLASLCLIGAPIAPAAAPSAFSERFAAANLAGLERRMVVKETPGGGARRVFPAEAYLPALFGVLSGQQAGRDEISTLIRDEVAKLAGQPDFLDLVTAYMDLPAEFFLDNVRRIYQLGGVGGACDAATRWRDRRLDPAALDGTALIAVEGGRDRICAPGQTKAVFGLSPGRPGVLRRALLAEQSGHFGLFYGPIWREGLAPRLLAAMRAAEAGRAA